jgi:ATP adenylyltransferase
VLLVSSRGAGRRSRPPDYCPRRARRLAVEPIPYNNGHLLVAPLRHVARLDELDEPVEGELFQTIARMNGLLERVMQPQGFNIGLNLGRAAGAGLPGHLHWHIVPRWVGDTNFMPTVAGVHTIPQSLEALWELLTAELKK